MNNLTEFIDYLKTQQQKHLAISKELANDERKDEAVLQKIRANVFEIFIAISTVAQKQSPDAPINFITDRIERICKPWEESLSQAKLHSDYTKITIEEIKITAIKEIQEKLAQIKEEASQ